MEARKKRFEDLNITRDEINSIGKALQKEEFRKLFVEYCEEVTSPESKKQYQQEVTELERQRGVEVTFINPEPGFVVKSSVNGERKAFINICKNDKVSKPSSSAASEEGTQGRRWSLPFSLAPAREDYDKQQNHCTVFDVVFHSETLQLAEKSFEFRKMVINTALDAVEDNCKAKLDRKNLKFPKMTYKGLPQAAVVRKKIPNHETPVEDHEFWEQIPCIGVDDTWSPAGKGGNTVEGKSGTQAYTVPKYAIKYRHGIDLADFTDDASSRLNATVPKALIISIDLPLLKCAKDLTLDVSHKSLTLLCEKPKYKLDLALPYGVDENIGSASFDVSTRKLSLELPVKLGAPLLLDIGREDSGVESDPGGRIDSDEKSPSENSDGGSDTSDHRSLQEETSLSDNLQTTEEDGNLHSEGLLSKDVEYILPNFTLNTFDNMVAVVLQVKNVESNSIVQCISPDGQSIQLSFTSLGGGLFPLSYGFCIAFPTNVCVEQDSLTVEAWDNNVVAQFGLTHDSLPFSEVLVGTGLHDLQAQDVTNLTTIEQKIANLKESTERAAPRSPLVEIHKAEENELVLKVESFSQSEKTSEEVLLEPDAKASDISSHSSASDKTIDPKVEKGRRSAIRQLSECSSDDLNGKKIRGILKKRPSRSLSESNADDYALFYRSASLSDEADSGSNSVMGSALHIGEGGSETGCDTENESGDRQSKKTVRFNDVVAQQTFRPNSSILGQRKKNQRKQKNKKRANERRASESENSEPDSEHDKARRRASHSEGEISDIEEKTDGKIKFMKDLKPEGQPQEPPQTKKILRRATSSDSDEEIKNEALNNTDKTSSSAGDTLTKFEASGKGLESSGTHGESSEDERDEKTEDKKKKKKKRKGKKLSEKGDSCEITSKPSFDDFKSNLVLELEM